MVVPPVLLVEDVPTQGLEAGVPEDDQGLGLEVDQGHEVDLVLRLEEGLVEEEIILVMVVHLRPVQEVARVVHVHTAEVREMVVVIDEDILVQDLPLVGPPREGLQVMREVGEDQGADLIAAILGPVRGQGRIHDQDLALVLGDHTLQILGLGLGHVQDPTGDALALVPALGQEVAVIVLEIEACRQGVGQEARVKVEVEPGLVLVPGAAVVKQWTKKKLIAIWQFLFLMIHSSTLSTQKLHCPCLSCR
ncbi:hypothetical protein FRC03_002968 [Tulasnella sp. 419]|nr:hypothetical protein FRC03_002968 [Tulasnella sp. 419]